MIGFWILIGLLFQQINSGYLLKNVSAEVWRNDSRPLLLGKISYSYFPVEFSEFESPPLIVAFNDENECLIDSFNHQFSWNLFSNLLILDLNENQMNVAENYEKLIYSTLIEFLEKYPDSGRNGIYLFGHGFDGLMTWRAIKGILDNFETSIDPFIDLKGMIQMNAPLSAKDQFNSLINMAYIKGILSKSDFDRVKSICGCKSTMDCDYFSHPETSECKISAQESFELSINTGLEPKGNQNLWKNLKNNQKRALEFYRNDKKIENLMVNVVNHKQWINRNMKLLLVYGDLDVLYNHIGATQFIERFTLKLMGKREHLIKIDNMVLFDFFDSKPWYFNYDSSKFCPSIGGFVKNFENGIDLATIKGGGHFPHLDRPAETFQLIKNFVYQLDYSQDLSAVEPKKDENFKEKKENEVFKRSNLEDFKSSSLNFTDHRSDLIKLLPGLDESLLKFNQFSGYLDGLPNHRIHYWLVESESNPSRSPLILWLNGGPGVSSLNGFFKENGPFQVTINGESLIEREYSWNKFANILYLESPVGVGYSYSTNPKEKFIWNDENTADENYLALLNFFEKFPEYVDRDFYITGESYAGIYLPLLAKRLINGTKNREFKGNFKGMAIGNAVLDYDLIRSDTLLHLMYYNGFTTYKTYKNLIESCCDGQDEIGCRFSDRIRWDHLGFPKPKNQVDTCFQMISKIFYEDFMNSRLDKCSPYSDCYWTPLKGNRDPAFSNRLSYSCHSKASLKQYLRRDDVRMALNLPKTIPKWQFYEKDSPSCRLPESGFLYQPWNSVIVPKNRILAQYRRQYWNMESIMKEILGQGIKILIYNGDTDLQANHLSSDWFIQRLASNLSLKTITPRSEWFFGNHTDSLAGYQTKYEKNLDLVTVKGAGHMVPLDRPEESFQMIFNWILGKDYSSPPTQ